MTVPLVSILIPAYNAGRWIGETLRSALDQTWPAIEVIVVDDGSRDDTLAVARRFEGEKVKVLTKPNEGAAATRNAAFAASRGQYIQWLDADDLLAPDKIENQMKVVASSGDRLELLSGSFGEFLVRPERAHFRPTLLWQDLTPVEYLINKFTHNAWMNPGAWLVSRELTERSGPWDVRLSLDDDGEYFSRVVAHSKGMRFVPEARVYYRRGNAGSLSRAVSDRACESLLLSLGLCIEHLRGLEDSEKTRRAGVTMLQSFVDNTDCFCPDAPARFDRAQQLAARLGGRLAPHRLTWKYAPIKAVFGWKAARWTRHAWSSAKLAARVRIAELTSEGSR